MIATRLTRLFGLRHPILGAPMAGAAGGRLAAAVTAAGGLGILGGGYGDPAWLEREFAAADAAGGGGIGCGLLTWRLPGREDVLDAVLARRPRALLLSFGDPRPHAAPVRAAGVPLIVMAQTLDDARRGVQAGAAAIVAQGAEAGGHSGDRATLTLVPEVADLLAREAPDVVPLAAGGIADGRGLAAALMLGAEGVLVGSRFWTAEEALVSPGYKAAAVAAGGDATLRTWMVGPLRGHRWPPEYRCRVLRSRFVERWNDDPDGLMADPAARAAWAEAEARGDAENGLPVVGEAVAMIGAVAPVAAIVSGMMAQAEACLRAGAARL